MLHPRPHLSWSQISVWEQGEDQYRKRYIEGVQLKNAGLDLGKRLANSLENQEADGDLALDLVAARLPKFADRERELKTTITVSGIEIPLLGKPDTTTPDLSGLKEYKSGQTEWTRKMVDGFGQITFYCVMIHAITGKIPQDIELVHAQTEWTKNGLEFTGKIARIPTRRSQIDIVKMKIRMRDAWVGIGEFMQRELL